MQILNLPLYQKQQKGEGTDCTFVFKTTTDNGVTFVEKTIQAHKLVLSTVSPFLEASFKEEWKGDAPIPMTTVDYTVFVKLLEIAYLSFVSFKTLDEALDLYEAANFYQMDAILDLLREKIKSYWFENKTLDIGKLLSITWKFQDQYLLAFAIKCFTANASKIVKEPDWLNYTPDLINFLYKQDDISATESDLINGLEMYLKEHQEKITNADQLLRPAIDSIRFEALAENEIEKTILLTSVEKSSYIVRKHLDVTYSNNVRKARREVPMFEYLSMETQQKLNEVYSKARCWYCEASLILSSHSVLTCQKVLQSFGYRTKVYGNSNLQNAENLKKLWSSFKSVAGSYTFFKYFVDHNLEDEMKTTFFYYKK